MIYLDYAATTPVSPLALKAFNRAAKRYPGNPNSIHRLGVDAAMAIDKSLARIRRMLGLPASYQLTPTSGASESNNLALKGVALSYAHKGSHIMTTSLEHSSITSTANYLARNEYDVELVPHDENGYVDVVKLEAMIRPDTTLISIGSINSEIGIRQPIREIVTMLKRHRHVIFHVDATQSIGKERLDLRGVDLISLTAHKFFGPKGIGLLIKHPRVNIVPLVHGGHSTTNDRRGTPATELVLSMERALKLVISNLEDNYNHVSKINSYLRNKLQSFSQIIINSDDDALPHVLNFSILGKSSTDTVHFLSERGIYISNHSACESDMDISLAVLSLTNDRARATSSVRISIAPMTTSDEIDTLVEAIKELIG